jgi:hypothetical protein
MPPERRVLDADLDNQCIFTRPYDRCNLRSIQVAVDDKASCVCRQVLQRVHKARASGRLRVRSSAALVALEFAKARITGPNQSSTNRNMVQPPPPPRGPPVEYRPRSPWSYGLAAHSTRSGTHLNRRRCDRDGACEGQAEQPRSKMIEDHFSADASDYRRHDGRPRNRRKVETVTSGILRESLSCQPSRVA